MWLQAIQLGIILADQVYHRFMETHPAPSRLGGAMVTIPRSDLGGAASLVFGWTRVKSPFLSWIGPLHTSTFTDANGNELYRSYAADMLFSCGIPMGRGATHGQRTGTSSPHLRRVWYGDRVLPGPGSLPWNAGGGVYDGAYVNQPHWNGGGGGGLDGAYYWFGGWTDQKFDFPSSPTGDTLAAYAASAGAGTGMYGGLPRQMCVAFHASDLGYDPGTSPGVITFPDITGSAPIAAYPVGTGFFFGQSPNINGINVEVQTYGDVVSGVTQHIFSMLNPGVDFGGDADPIEVIYDILTGDFGKCGIDPSFIDLVSFAAASATLKEENHGYSRAFEDAQPALDMIADVLNQIDATLFWNATTSQVQVKLVRNDYDPRTIPVIDRSNCDELQNLALGGWTGVPNKIVVIFEDRASEYRDGTAAAHNLASALGFDAQQREESVTYRGVKNLTLAVALAQRELAARSGPIMKCRALCDRSKLNVNPGDVVMLRWTDPDIGGIAMRVAAVNRGTVPDEKIMLDLIQDYFYVWRNQPPQHVGFGGHDADGGDGLTPFGG